MFQCFCPDCPLKEVIFSKEHLFRGTFFHGLVSGACLWAEVRSNKQTSVYLLSCSRCQKLHLLQVYLQNTHVLMPHSNKHRSSFSIERLNFNQPTENNSSIRYEDFGMKIHSYQVILFGKDVKLQKIQSQ